MRRRCSSGIRSVASSFASRRRKTLRSRLCWSAWQKRVEPGLAQQATQADQRQAEQAVEVCTLHGLKQCDAEAFGLEAAGAAPGLLALQVGTDFRLVERAELHRVVIHAVPVFASGCIEQYHGCVEVGPLAAAVPQLCQCAFEVAGCSEQASAAAAALVAADDQCAGVLRGQRAGLGQCQAQREGVRSFAWLWCFIHLRAVCRERQAESLQQVAESGWGIDEDL